MTRYLPLLRTVQVLRVYSAVKTESCTSQVSTWPVSLHLVRTWLRSTVGDVTCVLSFKTRASVRTDLNFPDEDMTRIYILRTCLAFSCWGKTLRIHNEDRTCIPLVRKGPVSTWWGQGLHSPGKERTCIYNMGQDLYSLGEERTCIYNMRAGPVLSWWGEDLYL